MYAENLKSLRKVLKLSSKEMAEQLCVAINSINNYENHRRKPNFEFLELLLNVYNVNLNWLMSGKGSMFNSYDKNDSPRESHTQIDEDTIRALFDKFMKEKGFI